MGEGLKLLTLTEWLKKALSLASVFAPLRNAVPAELD